MEIILLQDVENLGLKYDLVKVKPGYGRNFLIPKGLAKIANASNKKHLEEIKRQQVNKIAKQLEDYKALAEKIAGTKFSIGAKAGTTGKLFGSVTNVQLADAIKSELGIDVERKKIIIPNEIKDLGTYKATLHIFKEINADFEFEVIAE
ncbi:MAG: 50S ribosomal protein L9 [Chitinophagales bacterium]|nr:50S ribosomal protein L9 [Chitinophagales bacterium]MCZ2393453.1 50S ribosomal protein L9 [Chitinophagales bacterium]